MSSSLSADRRLLVNYYDAVIYTSDLSILDSSTAWLNDACINFQLTRLQQRQRERSSSVSVVNDEQDGITVEEQYLFLDPSVVSFLMHQLTEDDEDCTDELINLNVTWNLLLKPQRTTLSIPINDDTNNKHTVVRGKKRNIVIVVPISDQFGQSRTQFTKPGGGNHWSILLWSVVQQQQQQQQQPHHDDEKCRLTTTSTSSSKVDVRYYHFDSCQGTNRKAAEMVAHKLHRVLYAKHDVAANDGDSSVTLVSVIECQTPQQRNGYDCGVLALGFAEALTTINTDSREENDDINGKKEKYYESLLQSYFDKHGGHENFALRLRKQIGDAIRELVPFTTIG